MLIQYPIKQICSISINISKLIHFITQIILVKTIEMSDWVMQRVMQTHEVMYKVWAPCLWCVTICENTLGPRPG